MKRKAIRRGNEPYPALFAWMQGRPKAIGIFGVCRDFPLTTKELATIKTKQLKLFEKKGRKKV